MDSANSDDSNWLPPGARPPPRGNKRHKPKKRTVLGYSTVHWIATSTIIIAVVVWIWSSGQTEVVGDISGYAGFSANNNAAAVAELQMTMSASSDHGLEVFASGIDSTTLAVWEPSLSSAIAIKSTLVNRGGSIVLETEYSDGSSGSHGLIERPVSKLGERRFDIDPDSDRSEYITVSERGNVRYFGWEDSQFTATGAITVDSEFAEVGANPVEQSCIPKQLSVKSKAAVRLYEKLHSFRDDPEFARMGFSLAGRYHQWMLDAENLSNEDTPELWIELGFLAGDILLLGLEYMYVANGRGDLEYIRFMETTIRAALALARCDSEPNS